MTKIELTDIEREAFYTEIALLAQDDETYTDNLRLRVANIVACKQNQNNVELNAG